MFIGERDKKSTTPHQGVLDSYNLHDGISYTGKMSSLYWIRAQDPVSIWRRSLEGRDFHHQYKTVVRSSNLYNGNSSTGQTTSLYCDGPLGALQLTHIYCVYLSSCWLNLNEHYCNDFPTMSEPNITRGNGIRSEIRSLQLRVTNNYMLWKYPTTKRYSILLTF